MKKSIVYVVGIVALIMAGVLFLLVRHQIFSFQEGTTNPSTQASSSTNAAQSSKFESVDVLAQAENFSKIPQYVNTSTKTTIAFPRDNGQASRAEGVDVVINSGKIGTISGSWFGPFGFSPSGKYFAFGVYLNMGCCDINSRLGIINLAASPITINYFQPNIQSSPYQSSQYQPASLYNHPELFDKYIASGTWEASGDALDITVYYLWPHEGEATTTLVNSRVSPEEIWRYDLSTGRSTFIRAMP